MSPLATIPLGRFVRILKTLDPDDQLVAIKGRCAGNVAFFAAQCFPELITLQYSQAHRTILDIFSALPAFKNRDGLALWSGEAPRGMAKTTLLKIVMAHRIVHGLEPYLMWLGPSQPEARKELKHIKAMFESQGSALWDLYGPFDVGGSISEHFLITVPGVEKPIAIAARSAPKGTVRGSNYNGQRPTFVGADDIEKPKDCQNGTLRNEMSEWLRSDVLNAGPKEGGLVFWMQGTRLHPDSQLARNAKDPAFRCTRFQAVIRWPDNAELWAKCKAIWTDLDDEDREDHARDFYLANREAMDEGSEVLDPVNVPIYDLHVRLWRIGRRAFAKDQQNAPQMGDEALFDMDAATRCDFDGQTIVNGKTGRKVKLQDCKLSVFMDPRNSEAIAKNDFAAISVVARDDAGYRYLLITDMKRDQLSGGRARMWSYFSRFGPAGVRYGYEDNGAQVLHGESFEREKKERKRQGVVWAMTPKGHTSRENKIDRIASLQPDVENGWFQFAKGLPGEVIEQWRDLPNGAHDDGPDSAEWADRVMRTDVLPTIKHGGFTRDW